MYLTLNTLYLIILLRHCLLHLYTASQTFDFVKPVHTIITDSV